VDSVTRVSHVKIDGWCSACGKKHGRTSDRSWSGTFELANLVSWLSISMMPTEKAADRVEW
jgi:hypothetical protein